MPQPSVTEIHLKITYLKFNSNFRGANELNTDLLPLKQQPILTCCQVHPEKQISVKIFKKNPIIFIQQVENENNCLQNPDYLFWV